MEDKKKEITLPDHISQDKVDAWLKQYNGRVFHVAVEDDYEEKTYHAFFHEPDMKTLSAVSHESKEDDINAAVLLYNNCKIYADEKIEEVTSLKLSAMKELRQVVSLKKTKFQRL